MDSPRKMRISPVAKHQAAQHLGVQASNDWWDLMIASLASAPKVKWQGEEADIEMFAPPDGPRLIVRGDSILAIRFDAPPPSPPRVPKSRARPQVRRAAPDLVTGDDAVRPLVHHHRRRPASVSSTKPEGNNGETVSLLERIDKMLNLRCSSGADPGCVCDLSGGAVCDPHPLAERERIVRVVPRLLQEEPKPLHYFTPEEVRRRKGPRAPVAWSTTHIMATYMAEVCRYSRSSLDALGSWRPSDDADETDDMDLEDHRTYLVEHAERFHRLHPDTL